MNQHLYRYTFPALSPLEDGEGSSFPGELALEDVEAALVLALFATESLHGESQTRLDAAHTFDAELRSCVIDASTAVGRDLNRIFVGFLRREFPEDAFTVERMEKQSADEPALQA